jgi:hypothetical protein
MKPRRAWLWGLLSLGCGSATLPQASVTSVKPEVMVASQPTRVAVQLDVQLPVQADFGNGSINFQSELQVRVGPQPLGANRYPPDGLVQGTLATTLPPGTYDVTVALGDGRSAALREAFTVVPGMWPSGYTFEPIDAQRSGTPFSVTLHATGANATGFEGNVLLGASSGFTVTPSVSGGFTAGVRVETVTVTGAGQVVLTASDIAANNGQSAPFTVRP